MIEKIQEERDKLFKRLQNVKTNISELQVKEARIESKLEKMKKKHNTIENKFIENRKELMEIENEYSNMKQKQTNIDEETAYSNPGEDLNAFLSTASFIYDNSNNLEIEKFKNSKEGTIIEKIRSFAIRILALKKQTGLIKNSQVELTFFDKALINKEQIAVKKELKKIETSSVMIIYKRKSYSFVIKNDEDSHFKALRDEACKYFNLYNNFYLLVDEKERVWPKYEIVYTEQTKYRIAQLGNEGKAYNIGIDDDDGSQDREHSIYVELKAKVDIKFFLNKHRYYRKTAEEVKSELEQGVFNRAHDPYNDGLTKIVEVGAEDKQKRPIKEDGNKKKKNKRKFEYLDEGRSSMKSTNLQQLAEIEKKERLIWHRTNARKIMVYLIFCIFLNLSIFFTKDNNQISYLKLLIEQKFLKIPFPIYSNNPKTFDTISSTDEIFTWLTTATTYIIQSSWYNGDAFNTDEKSSLYYSNKIIGPVRILQKRIRPKGCVFGSPGLNTTDCYDEWADTSEDTSFINISYPVALSRYIFDEYMDPKPSTSQVDLLTLSDLKSLFSRLKEATYFNSYPYTRSIENQYEQSGYQILFYKSNSAPEIIQLSAIVANDWINIKTSALIVNFNIYNPDCDAFLALEVVFEFHSTGKFSKKSVVKATRLYYYWQTYDIIHIAFEFCAICMLLFYLYKLVRSIRSAGWKIGLAKWPNLLICFLFLLMLIKYVLIVSITLNNQSKFINYSSTEYVDVMELLSLAQGLDIIEGLLSSISILYVFKYFDRSLSVRKMWMTLKKARAFLFFFFLLVMNIFLGITYMLTLIFGEFIGKYTTVISGLGSVFQSVLEIFDFNEHYQYDSYFTIVYFVFYLLFIKFILLNVFLAIINDCYGSVNNETKEFQEEMEKDELSDIFKALWDLFIYLIKIPLKVVSCYIILELITGERKKAKKERLRKAAEKAKQEEISGQISSPEEKKMVKIQLEETELSVRKQEVGNDLN